ncbi:hypothetical protein Tco_0040188 [Tanacetum coccineum]
MEAGIKLMPHMGKPVNQLEYSRAIGCLMYAMTSTRPDIAYAVGKLSRFTSNPSNHHWEAIIKVFRYLKKTMNYGFSYVGFPSIIKGYSNASWITNSEDQSSTMVVILVSGGVIVALAAAGKEAEWLRNLIYEIPLWPKPISSISMHCDSATTLAKAYSQIYNGKSRYLGVKGQRPLRGQGAEPLAGVPLPDCCSLLPEQTAAPYFLSRLLLLTSSEDCCSLLPEQTAATYFLSRLLLLTSSADCCSFS